MAANELTFADPELIIPSVVLEPLRDGGYRRVWNLAAFAEGENQGGKDIFKAKAIGSKYIWPAIGGKLTAAALSNLDEMIAKQDGLLSDGTEYLIHFTDEVRRVFASPPPHPKNIVSGLSTKTSGAIEGFARFNVKVDIEEDHGEYYGESPQGPLYTVALVVREIL